MAEPIFRGPEPLLRHLHRLSLQFRPAACPADSVRFRRRRPRLDRQHRYLRGPGSGFYLQRLSSRRRSYKLSEHWKANGGILYQHLSNGGQTDPNPSLNLLGRRSASPIRSSPGLQSRMAQPDENVLVVRRNLFDELGNFDGLKVEPQKYLDAFLSRGNNFFLPRAQASRIRRTSKSFRMRSSPTGTRCCITFGGRRRASSAWSPKDRSASADT